ncbi:uncharacterized protein LOC118292847 [Scophthalmus maximus]|uniref:uncharacterized protein LOC118292847 n=1 Tax=Scophthalmus maximus TaxID=52904 RepID=UPI001FA876DB|nr:uncharacterized protein LOC118292847 [Scophthalmus maximus]
MKSGRTTAVESQEDECVTEGGRSSAASEEAGRSSAASEKAGRSSAASEKAGPSSAASEEEAGSSSFSPWSSGSGRGNLMRQISLPPSMEDYLRTYRAHHEGLDPTPKMTENAISKVSRVKTFILYMANNRSRLSDWLFLDNMSRIRGWSRSVVEGGMKITTAKFYLQNALHFVRFMTGIPPKTCRLTRVQFTSVERELKTGVRSLQRRVVVHQMSTKRIKISKLPSRQALRG